MKITIDPSGKGERTGNLFGIFFEDLNHAADGGLYAEMVRNRAFEFAPIDNKTYTNLTAWEKIEKDGTANLVVETGNPVSCQNPHYLGLDIIHPGGDVGVWNTSYNSGFAFEAGSDYYFSCYAKREQDFDAPLRVSFRSAAGEVYTEQKIKVTDEWQKYELVFTAPYTDYSGRLAITAEGRGKLYLDFVSLFPKDTYKGRRNGLRRDLAEMLEDLHPKFMRFPGGCLVHDGTLDGNARDSQYRWKNTIGPIEDRPARRNNWGYNQSLGIGYYEYFQLCEDIGAKPIPVLPAGYNPHSNKAAPLDRLQPWIDDALDLIEFANGGPETIWGGKRAALGHPSPFGLEYIAVGNEEVGAGFFERYEIIFKAIREKYPEIKVIGTSGPFAAGGEFERGWQSARETGTDLVDEHYYQTPEWFLANHHRYDGYDKNGPKVFLGEYASWGNNWRNALAEGSYMIGLERNAGTVALACYAPLFCNADYIDWQPDMIWFDNHRAYGTANYYVQKLFMNNQGDRMLDVSLENAPENKVISSSPDRISGEIRIRGYDSTAEFSDITFVDNDTGKVTVYPNGTVMRGDEKTLCAADSVNYTLTLKAKELDGFKGFQIRFGYHGEDDNLSWTLGGWQNQDNTVSERINGHHSDLSQYQIEMRNGKEYLLRLEVRGRNIRTSVDGICVHDIDYKPVILEPLYCSASADEKTGEVIFKAVNMENEARTAEIRLRGGHIIKDCTVFEMHGWPDDAKNSFEDPDMIKPKEFELKIDSGSFAYSFPEKSLTVLRFRPQDCASEV